VADVSLNSILYAVLGGAVPTFLWLWFWLSKDDRPEPGMVLTLAFIGGALSVVALLPLRPYVQNLPLDPQQVIIFYAALEEVSKFIVVALITFGSRTLVESTDYTIYLVTGALGFSALENTFYLINPILQSEPLQSIVVTGNLRFFGATVLHTISVAIVGVLLGLVWRAGFLGKALAVLFGIVLGTGLHSVFNYFIMQNTRQGTITAIAGVWFVAIIVILIFDRLRAMHQVIVQQEYQL
jgi:RsiW-degrading membrane proteinase PrsW (M82 family)